MLQQRRIDVNPQDVAPWLMREFLRDVLITTFSPRDGLCTTPCLRYTATFVERLGALIVDLGQLSLARLFANSDQITRVAGMPPQMRAAIWTPITQQELDQWSASSLDMAGVE